MRDQALIALYGPKDDHSDDTRLKADLNFPHLLETVGPFPSSLVWQASIKAGKEYAISAELDLCVDERFSRSSEYSQA